MRNSDNSDNGLILDINVRPRASKNSLQRTKDGKIKLRLTSPPIDGLANERCIEYLAKLFSIPRQRISIIKGLKSREKMIKIKGISKKELLEILEVHAIIKE